MDCFDLLLMFKGDDLVQLLFTWPCFLPKLETPRNVLVFMTEFNKHEDHG